MHGVTVRRRRDAAAGAAVLAAVLTALLAGCSNHSGLRRLHPTDGARSTDAAGPVAATVPAGPVPAGLAGSAAAAASAGPSRPAGSSRSPGPGAARPTGPAAVTRASSAHPAPGRPTGSSPPRHHPTPSSPPRSPSPVPPSPSVTVSPGRGLHNVQQVAVSGAAFRSGEQLGVQECRTSLSTCDPLAARVATVDGGGAFGTTLTVHGAVGLSSCGANGCVIRVRRASGDVFVVPISFG